MSAFTVYPAIDLKGGRCVRLLQGRADAETVYGSDPVEMALKWRNQGATWLHVVDLDGAFQGTPAHTETITKIVEAIKIPVQVGGGIRTDEDIRRLLGCGAARVILGTRAWADPAQLAQLAQTFGDKLAVGIDSRDGRVQIKGWTETTQLTTIELARRADTYGIKTLIVTDTATDGMLQGPNLAAMKEVCAAVKASVIASGGVSQALDITALKRLGCPNLAGAIVGKALYEGRATLAALQAA